MATVTTSKKAVSVNPLKLSQPLGAALAFLGIKGMMPLFHGTQGCTAFAKVILVRHFCEAIPLATTAMSEVTSILGGEDNIEQAILTQMESSKPEIIGLLTTALTETRGDDVERILKTFRANHPELDGLPVVYASTPDYKGSLQDGFATAVERIVEEIPRAGEIKPNQITILAGSSFGPGDVEEVKEIVEAFGLTPIVVPDLSTSLDGHLSDQAYNATSSGGTSLAQLWEVGNSSFTLALGESMRGAAQILQQRFSTNYHVFQQLTGLGAVDDFLLELSKLSEHAVPEKYRRQRRQLQDAMLDNHFFFGRKRISLALEPDLLYATAWCLKLMGAQIHSAVTTTRSPLLEQIPVETVVIGDLGDFEEIAVGSDLLITNSHGLLASQKLGIPLYRQGMPIFDRLGNGQRCCVGYRGTMQLLFDIGNLLLEEEESIIKERQLSFVSSK
ncbi:MAG: nitrogenase iron-molybdenum cofactor biosynthesis protein NifN [Symploca sp. SIO3C6]|uniref:Nitrogenase iron-molybdenum cofactor biosynthesis protein NifN n=1 Tax=Symploca sp. SIO1C4 TaxID=2607765 RepID=A0A6B3N3T3_9CYAN|nr:nitrogenase iron-molybdenum cofactor biosynthesis protein NifN [Symploca sp. SIO3C6]NER27749.1 nitrogenase iron-molybdenum cofactor biosynthesis protein NifN [Symploca sp. SIO1C4]NET05824.1 nitrogenase iron-molybdenum cofactor biosynthesis protein NifN [Symploca sp. SIO2B6]